jgi:hypothetical protein
MMKTLPLLITFCFLVSAAYPQPLSDVRMKSSSVLRRTPGGERQIVIAEFTSEADLSSLTATIVIPGMAQPVVARLDQIGKGKDRRFVEIPVMQKNDSVEILLTLDGKAVFSGKSSFSPPRRRRVYDVQVSHHDLGYADYYHLMRRDVREMGLEMALDYCRRTDSWDKSAQFHWTVETSEPMTKFISSQPVRVIDELARRIREGRIDLGGVHNSVYTEMMGYESMARLLYTPNRYICDLLNISPSRTALISDVVGFSRTLPLYLKEADIPYFYHGYNETVDGLAPASANPVFYWKANDGDDRNMSLFRSFPYYSPDRMTKYDVNEIAALLDRYDANERWVYSCLIAEDSYDFSVPHFENVEGIRKWNEQYSNPLLISGTFTMFFDDIMKQAGTTQIPVYDSDAPNAWADQDGADGRLMGDARLLNDELPTVEKLSTLAYASGGKGYPWRDIWQAYHKLVSYHEHTNGAFSEEDVLPIPLLKDKKAANANYYECEQVMHKALVREAGEFTNAAKSQSIGQLKQLISTLHDSTIVVFNPLNFHRSGPVSLELETRKDISVVDNESGKVIAVQAMTDGRFLFNATDIPSMGYRTYRIAAGRASRPVPATMSARNGVLENAYYRLRIDDSTGAVSSILDKKRNIELVDQKAPYKLNEYIYQRLEEPFAKKPKAYRPTKVSWAHFSGPVAAGITTLIRAMGCESVEQTVTLYNNSDRIDFAVNLDKSESGKPLKQATNQNKEALFYALPFNVPDFTIRHELAGGVVEPLDHQFQGSTSNYFGIQHFSDLSNGQYGITLSTINAPLLEYGTPRPALWLAPSDMESIIKKPSRSHVFLYLMNNMFFTNIPVSQPGRASFRWSIRSHDRDWAEGKAYEFGWEASHPFEVFLIEKKHKGMLPDIRHSFLSIDRANIIVSTVKPAEANGEGFILRFFELSGERSDVRVTLNMFDQIASANETNLVESDRPIPVRMANRNQIVFSINPFGIKTIRIIPAARDRLTQPTGLKAKPLSDREIALSWDESRGSDVSYYQVFRGMSPDFKPGLINRVAAVPVPEYTDKPVLNHGGWLDNRVEPNTTYYYKVEAVGRFNNRSTPSAGAGVKSRLASEKNSVPGKVLGLAATSVSPITSYHYLCLLFYTNNESDVTRYRIYRSERPGFRPDVISLLDEIDATQRFQHITPHGYATVTRELRDYTMMVYPDESARPNRKYYYRVCAVDEAGQAGEPSDETSAMSEIKRLSFEGSRFFFDSATVDIRPMLDDGSQIRYTTDGSVPTLQSPVYARPFVIHQPTRIVAALFYPRVEKSAIGGEANYLRALHAPPKYLQPYSEKWPGQGPLNLVDGAHGHAYFDGYFQGFEQNDMDVVIDLGGKKEIGEVTVTMLQDIRSWIFYPEKVEFFISHDGANFESVGDIKTVNENERKDGVFTKDYTMKFDRRSTNFVRVRAKSIAMCPPWHIGYELKGNAWVFADEISIR